MRCLELSRTIPSRGPCAKKNRTYIDAVNEPPKGLADPEDQPRGVI